MRAPVLFLLCSLLFLPACRQAGILDLEALQGRAQAGDPAALRQMIALLGETERGLNARVYPMLLAVGEPAIPFLLAETAGTDSEQREHVIAALGTLQVPAAVEPIARVLGDHRLERRYVAAWALGKIGDPRGIPPLVAALDDDNAEVRRGAVRALIRLNRAAVPALIDSLTTASPRGVEGAVRVLGDIADPRALEPLLALTDGPARREVFHALGKLREPRAEAVLAAGLADPEWQVRMSAAMALGSVGGVAATTALTRSLEDEVVVVREWSSRSLEVITGKHVRYRNEDGEYVLPYSIYH